MILAELEVFHSRPIAPTRRVALGHRVLPCSPVPGFGGLLLGGVVAAHMPALDPDLFDDLHRLTVELEDGRAIPQPRLRHRLQRDRVGLLRSVHRLEGSGEQLRFALDDKGAAAQHILAAVYAAGELPGPARHAVMGVLRKAMRWSGPLDRTLVAHLSGLERGREWSSAAFSDPVGWAKTVLGLHTPGSPTRGDVLRGFRDMVRDAHPDHGGDRGDAAQRIADLAEARRILLAS